MIHELVKHFHTSDMQQYIQERHPITHQDFQKNEWMVLEHSLKSLSYKKRATMIKLLHRWLPTLAKLQQQKWAESPRCMDKHTIKDVSCQKQRDQGAHVANSKNHTEYTDIQCAVVGSKLCSTWQIRWSNQQHQILRQTLEVDIWQICHDPPISWQHIFLQQWICLSQLVCPSLSDTFKHRSDRFSME